LFLNENNLLIELIDYLILEVINNRCCIPWPYVCINHQKNQDKSTENADEVEVFFVSWVVFLEDDKVGERISKNDSYRFNE